MADDIQLSIASRTNLLTLQRTTELIGRTQDRLATGKKVNSALDDALAFFKARNLNNRASDLSGVKDGILQAVNIVEATTKALESVEDLLKQAKAIAESARATTDSSVRQDLATQYNTILTQIDNLVADASYDGTNLLNAQSTGASSTDTLTVRFNEDGSNTLTINGQLSLTNSSGLNVSQAGTAPGDTLSFSTDLSTAKTNIDTAISSIDSALTTVRSSAQTFGTNAAILGIRREFTEELINTLEGGAAQLVNADVNEESANLLSLQTRQQLGTISLSIAQQSEQSVLRLF